MGRTKDTPKRCCLGTHWTWGQRNELQRCWIGTKTCPRERRPGVLAQLMNKSRKTIARELARGMALHVKSDLTEEWEYNADHAQMDADYKKTAKGPKPKSGRRWKLLERISQLILKEKRSPCAIVRILWEEGVFNKGFSVCEKTIHNWIDAGDIPNVTRRSLPRGGKINVNFLNKFHSI